MNDSDFRAWFREQHGERPVPTTDDEALREAVRRGEIARETLHACAMYDARLSSALWAWRAKGEKR